jgi:DNA repair exonuclease SbcCD nuclease subunit
MGATFLCTADIHLGRRSSRLPGELTGEGTGALSPEAAFERLVERALADRVDAVLLAGDVVDRDNRFYEAFSVLQEGVRKLVDQGIAVVAVAGNHDHDVLGRLADAIPQFRLLGDAAGGWSSVTIQKDGAPLARLAGWSFPAEHVRQSPMANFPAGEARDDLPLVGLLHCDCDVAASPYAPVSRAELAAAPVSAWVLGHLHQGRRVQEAGPLILYPGSLQGLDPTETGPHGPWRMEIESDGSVRAEPLDLAPLRWEALEVDLGGCRDVADADRAILKAFADHGSRLGGCEALRAVGVRLTLTGRTDARRDLAGRLEGLIEDLRPSYGGIGFFLDAIEDRTAPAMDLRALARSKDPAGLLARKLLVLESGEPAGELQRILKRGRAAVGEIYAIPAFRALGDEEGETLDDEALRTRMLRSARSLLDTLFEQREAAP